MCRGSPITSVIQDRDSVIPGIGKLPYDQMIFIDLCFVVSACVYPSFMRVISPPLFFNPTLKTTPHHFFFKSLPTALA